ncbi:MAG: glycosyltransferase [Phycisphaerae bacterium]|nr:glycosyltransferase [Phycisphaerae bacterium]
MIVVHVTHEVVEKIGGIGAVIVGLVTSKAYQKAVSRTILVGPLLETNRPVNRRLGEGGKIIYSSLDEIYTSPWRERFMPVERTYDVGIIYGTRQVQEPCNDKTVEVEALVIDVFHANRNRLNLFKGELYKKFAIPSDAFESIWEYEEYVRLAVPAVEALGALGCFDDGEQVAVLAHEYMGMPTALKAVLDGKPNTRTVFYAHEVASVRPIIEKTPGHDTTFYNVLRAAMEEGRTLEQVFPEVFTSYKHPLVKAARYCDHVFAVGDYIEEELRFLDPHFRTMDIDLVYNGVPTSAVTMESKTASMEQMRTYAANLFGSRPTWVFTHVCRPVLSKGIWRDLGVLHSLDAMLASRGESAVYFMLGTLGGQRRPQDVRHMERVYGWPVTHERGYPDLCGGEETLGDMFDNFNRNHHAVRVVLVNQWDWNRRLCGDRMPENMTFADIRRGTDVELGLSVYEPFGISQLEPMSCGAMCVVSNVCGCAGFARRASGGKDVDNFIVADYLKVAEGLTVEQLLHLPASERDRIESQENQRLAELIFQRLPRDSAAIRRGIEAGSALAANMSWEHVVRDYFLPSLARATARR